MISHKHKCIFVHVPKVAGISIEEIFLKDLDLDFENRMALLLGKNTNKNIGPPRISHLTAKEYIDYHFISNNLYESYFKFSFVRNPYDRIFSLYRYLGFDKFISYKKFILVYLPIIFKQEKLKYFLQPMSNYLFSENGSLMVDFVGRLEAIDEDFSIVQEKCGLKNEPLPHNNKSEEMGLKTKIIRGKRIIKNFPGIVFDYRFSKQEKKKNYTLEMKEVIDKLYGVDFRNFNYEQ